MKSGLEGRNNQLIGLAGHPSTWEVSMKSGLEGRNNSDSATCAQPAITSLNEVRPRRPEQSAHGCSVQGALRVSMKSGLEGRNNCSTRTRMGRAQILSQ